MERNPTRLDKPAITLLASTHRATVVHPPTWRTWAGLIVLPVLVMSLFPYAFLSPQTNRGAAKAVVVNNDRPVTVDGQTIPSNIGCWPAT